MRLEVWISLEQVQKGTLSCSGGGVNRQTDARVIHRNWGYTGTRATGTNIYKRTS